MTEDLQAEAALLLVEEIALALIGPAEDDAEADDVVVEAEIGEQRSFAAGGRFASRGGEPATVLRLSVIPSEMAQVIGRQGRTAHSLRTIVNALGVRQGRRYVLEIVEQAPEGAANVPLERP